MVGRSSVAGLNLAFLMYLRESLMQDRLQTLADFEIEARLADRILALTTDQLIRLAHADLLLVGLRWRRLPVWSCLGDYAEGADAALPRALIAAESGRHGYET